MMHDYTHEALDLALVCRRAVSSGDLSELFETTREAEARVLAAAEARAAHRALRTGASSLALEEETQALLVACLLADPLAWVPGRVGVVDVNHSPQGAGKSRFQAAAMSRAGARAGWPDLDVRVVTPTGPRGVLIELKVGRGRESAEQRRRRGRLVSAGHDVRVARGLGEALVTVVGLLIGELSTEVPF